VFALQIRTLSIACLADHSTVSTHSLAIYATNRELQTNDNAMQNDWGAGCMWVRKIDVQRTNLKVFDLNINTAHSNTAHSNYSIPIEGVHTT